MVCCWSLRHVQDLLGDGTTPYERRSGEPFKGPSDLCQGPVEAPPSWQESFTWNIPRMCINRGWNLERRYLGDRHGGIGKHERIRNPSSKKQCKRSIDATKGRRFYIPKSRWSSKIVRRDCEFQEPTPRREPTVRSEDLSGELQGEPEVFQPTEAKDDAEARKDFWSTQGDFICRHHIEPRVELHVPKEETLPIPLTYFDATRTTNTTFDVMLEKITDNCWKVDGDHELSDTWTGFTTFTVLSEKPPDIHGPGGD